MWIIIDRSHLVLVKLVFLLFFDLELPTVGVHRRGGVVRGVAQPSTRTQRTVVVRGTALQGGVVGTAAARILVEVAGATDLA